MSIRLPQGLAARRTLEAEGVEVVHRTGGQRRGMPALRIALLNLMPQKAPTETQIARLLGSSAFHVELTLFVPDSYSSKNTPAEYMAAFYEPWSRIRDRQFDGLVVTGAPVETLAFEDVTYWRELTAIFDWARSRVLRTYYICWAAQAALYHFHGVPKHSLGEKRFGVFRQRVVQPDKPLLRGFDGEFMVPVSRRTEVRTADLPRRCGLDVLADSPESGLCLVEDRRCAAAYMFNHLEYDAGTLKHEYLRDLDAGQAIGIPRNYFPDDDPGNAPADPWRPHAHLLFQNWLGEIARGAHANATKAPAIQWLLAQDRKPSLIGACCSEFLISADNSLNALPTVLRWFAAHELSPKAVKVHRPEGLDVLIELRFDRVADPTVERISRELLSKVPEIRRVAYCSSGGSSGILGGHQEGSHAQTSIMSDAEAAVPANPAAA